MAQRAVTGPVQLNNDCNNTLTRLDGNSGRHTDYLTTHKLPDNTQTT